MSESYLNNIMAKEEHFNETGLHVASAYTRQEIAEICNVTPPINSRDWGGLREYENCILLFVTLDKKDFDSSIQYEDIFDDEGQTFFWESQNRSSQKTAVIQRIIQQVPVLLFCRLTNKVKGKTQPFIYVGHLHAENYEGEKPVSFEYTVLDYKETAHEVLQELYFWHPNKQRRKRPIEVSPERKARQQEKKKKIQARKGQGRLVDSIKKESRAQREIVSNIREYSSLAPDITVEEKISKICWNTNGWQHPSGLDGKSKDANSHERTNGYGHEEWLFDFDKIIDGYHYAFLQPVNKHREKYTDNIYNIDLYTVRMTKKGGDSYWVSRINGLEVINKDAELDVIKEYRENGWLNEIIDDVERVSGSKQSINEWIDKENLFNVRFKPENVEWFGAGLLPFKEGEKISHTRYTLLNKSEANCSVPNINDTDISFSGNTKKETQKGERDYSNLNTVQYSQLHTKIQNSLSLYLRNLYPLAIVDLESPSGNGTNIDVVFVNKNIRTFFEVKTYPDVRKSIREALGQLLEYCHYPEKELANNLIVVSQAPINNNDRNYLDYLERKYSLRIGYVQFDHKVQKILMQHNCHVNSL